MISKWLLPCLKEVDGVLAFTDIKERENCKEDPFFCLEMLNRRQIVTVRLLEVGLDEENSE